MPILGYRLRTAIAHAVYQSAEATGTRRRCARFERRLRLMHDILHFFSPGLFFVTAVTKKRLSPEKKNRVNSSHHGQTTCSNALFAPRGGMTSCGDEAQRHVLASLLNCTRV